MALLPFKISPIPLALSLLAAVPSALAAVDDDNWIIEEIVVTAQKRSESLQDVPIAISAFSDDFLTQTQSTDISDVSLYTPGFTSENTFAGTPLLAIRGIGSTDFGIGSDPSVGIYMDGVYMGRNGGSVIDFLDVERVEVLKGPQGTLFGRNATGGAINVITQKPGHAFEGSIGAFVGRFHERNVEGTVSLPLIEDELSLRIAGRKRDRDGWQENLTLANDNGAEIDRGSLRAILKWSPTETLNITLANDWYSEKENFGYADLLGGVFVDPVLSGGFPSPVEPAVMADSRSAGLVTLVPDAQTYNAMLAMIGEGPVDPRSFDTGDSKHFSDGTEPLSQRVVRGNALTVSWDISDDLSLSSITAYRQHDMKVLYDGDGSGLDVLDVPDAREETETYSQELRLNGHSESVDWFVGASAYKETNYGLSRVESSVYAAYGLNADETTISTTKAESYAIYADATWAIDEKWSITLGGRYSRDAKSISTDNPIGSGIVFASALHEQKHENWENFSPRVAVDYALTKDVLLFASVTQGYKSGGFNTYPSVAGEPAFDPEEVTNIEFGIKSTLLNGRLRLNASLFDYQYEDLQQLQSRAGSLQIVNAGKASGRGLELDAIFMATESLTLMAAIGLTDAEYDTFDLPVSLDLDADGIIDPLLGEFEGALDLSGEEMSRSPRFTGTLGVDYLWSLDDAGSLRFNSNYAYTGEQRHSAVPLDIYEEDGYGLLSARVSYVSADDSLEVSFYGANLTDEDYIASRGSDSGAFGFIGARRGEPRTWGIGAKLFF